jgi:hypothetical protein
VNSGDASAAFDLSVSCDLYIDADDGPTCAMLEGRRGFTATGSSGDVFTFVVAGEGTQGECNTLWFGGY